MRGCAPRYRRVARSGFSSSSSSNPSVDPRPASEPSSSSTRCCRTGRRNSFRPAVSTTRWRRRALWDDKGRWRGPLLVDQALQHHLLQVGYVDAILGTLVRRLQAVGLVRSRARRRRGRPRHQLRARRISPRGDRGERRGHRRRPVLCEVPGTAARRRRPARRRDDRRRPDDRRRGWRPDPVACRRTIASRCTRCPDGHRERRLRAGLDTRGGGCSRACSRPPAATRRCSAKADDSLYRLGPQKALVGRVVGGPRGASAERDGVRLDYPSDVRRCADEIAVRPVTDRRRRRRRRCAARPVVGIAVNGRIAATTETFADGGQSHFISLVPEGAFRDGANCRRRVRDSGRRRRHSPRPPGRDLEPPRPAAGRAPRGAVEADGRGSRPPSDRDDRDQRVCYGTADAHRAAVLPLALRPPRRAVGVRGQPARLLDAEGEPGVPRYVRGRRGSTSWSSRSCWRSSRRSSYWVSIGSLRFSTRRSEMRSPPSRSVPFAFS